MKKIKLKWEISHLANKQKPIIPDCLKSCFCGAKMNDRKDLKNEKNSSI